MKAAQRRLTPTILPHLLATGVEYPFGGTTIETKAFFLQRPAAANVWIYSSSHVGEYTDHIQELGGVTKQLLNHRDEAGRWCNVLEAPVFCHVDEKEAIEAKGCVVGETYDTKVHALGDDLLAYHTPGHAAGVTSYLWKCDDGTTTVLFTGDSLYCNEQRRLAHGPLQYHAYPGNKDDMIRSFQLYLDLNPTYLVSGLTGSDFLVKFDREQVSELIEQLQKE